MKETPLVSIIMPAYNSAHYIREAITSVQKQTYRHWELLVIDDASIDNTIGIVEEILENDSRVRLLRNETNEGTGAARNSGTRAAQGHYIAFLDSDDIWLPQKLEKQLNFMKKEILTMTFSSYFLISEDKKDSGQLVQALPVLSYQKLLKANYVGNLTGIYDVNALGKIYSPLLRKRQDWALWLKILKITGKTKALKEPLACYRVRKNSISQNKLALIKYNFKIYKEVLEFNYIKSCKYMAAFLWEHFLIKNKQKRMIKEEM